MEPLKDGGAFLTWENPGSTASTPELTGEPWEADPRPPGSPGPDVKRRLERAGLPRSFLPAHTCSELPP